MKKEREKRWVSLEEEVILLIAPMISGFMLVK
jgi:hypothetical protein